MNSARGIPSCFGSRIGLCCLAVCGALAACNRAPRPADLEGNGNRIFAASEAGGRGGKATAESAVPDPVRASASVVEGRTFRDRVVPFLRQHCVRCHGSKVQKAKLRLDTLGPDFGIGRSAETWLEVLDRLNLGEMPPKGAPRPSPEDAAVVIEWISASIRHAQQRAGSTGGRALLRRLTRTEYANTVRDLLAVDFVPGQAAEDLLPPDGTLHGLNKISLALRLDASLLDTYFRVAEVVANRAIVTRPPRVPTRTIRFDLEDLATAPGIRFLLENRSLELKPDGIVLMEGGARTLGQLKHPYNGKQIPVRGRYALRIRAAADAGKRGEPIYLDVRRGAEGRVARLKVTAPLDRPEVYEVTRIFDAAVVGEFELLFANGIPFTSPSQDQHDLQHLAYETFRAGRFNESSRIQARLRAEGLGGEHPNPHTLATERLPKVFLDYVEIEGPLYGPWPPASMRRIFHEGLAPDGKTIGYASKIFARLLPRAYRRPIQPSELQAVLDLVSNEMRQGAPFEEAVKAGLIAMLCSPHFLHLFEPSTSPSQPRRLNDFELATRLSYFLWSSMPDDELVHLAKSGKLHEPDVFAAQLDRMLTDPKAEALVSDFANQWLKVNEFDRFQPDERLYRVYYATHHAGIDQDLKNEPLAFFREILARNESVLRFLASDWTMANGRLAAYYGIDGVQGEAFRRVKLPANSPRGGLIGMAGLHRWGSDGNRTKPVERGKYILDVLFNAPPDPPPPNAGEVQPNTGAQHRSVRERLEHHRQIESCAHCHRRIDPYGLALENFNAIGLWRDVQDGEQESWGSRAPRIDASGTLPNGRHFESLGEFKRALLDQGDRFQRALAEKLLMYALGRSLEPADRATIDQLVANMKSNGNTLRSLLKGIALSTAFRTK